MAAGPVGSLRESCAATLILHMYMAATILVHLFMATTALLIIRTQIIYAYLMHTISRCTVYDHNFS